MGSHQIADGTYLGRAKLCHADFQGVCWQALDGSFISTGNINVPLQPMSIIAENIGASVPKDTEMFVQNLRLGGEAAVQFRLQTNFT